MGSTICVRCGAGLIPHSYCNVCHNILCFTCSSCFTNTDERIHAYCQNTDSIINDLNSDSGTYIENNQKLMKSRSQLILDDNHVVNTNHYTQSQLHDETKYNSIIILTSYWESIFESIKLVNSYWAKILNIGINNSIILYSK
jgi:hypothetical protein